VAVYQRGAGGHVAEREQPEPGSDREKELERLVESGEGHWSRVEEPKKRRSKKKDDSESGQGDGGEDGSDDTETVERPAKNASQEAWAAYAVTQGADEGEAKAATRDDLIKAYGG
jgi:hypothetical protein